MIINYSNFDVQTMGDIFDKIAEIAENSLRVPSSDISEEEQKLLREYVADGGKLMVYAGSLEAVNAIALK